MTSSSQQETGEIACPTPADVIEGLPSVYNGLVFTTQPSGVVAYNAQTGEQAWQFDGEGGLPPVVSDNGIVFYLQGFGEYELYALNAQDGTLRWKSPQTFHLDVFGMRRDFGCHLYKGTSSAP
ncbi:MAG: PQQ-binding-like beta-propeller repeat protein [bacterium]|nr:PQQ-binding-like beta-propeller repeat protein [bacterium]